MWATSTCCSAPGPSFTGSAINLAAGATTVKVSDNSRFPGSGTVQADDEQMTYTGKSGTTGRAPAAITMDRAVSRCT